MHAAGACASPAAGAARCSQLRACAQSSVRGAALAAPAPSCGGGRCRCAPRLRLPARAAISVDRRSVLEARWARQAALEVEDELSQRSCPCDCVVAVRDLAHLEALCAAAGPDAVVLLYLYLDSCGICKYVLPAVEDVCRAHGAAAGLADAAAGAAPPRALVLKHCLRDEYDDLTDIARLYRIKSAPSFACFVEGALVDTWSGGNSQRLHAAIARYGNTANAANAR